MAETPNSIEKSDESLMVDVQHGDHEAFAILVRRHTKMFFSAAYRMCSSQDEAEDIVQEAFLKLWKNPHGWSPDNGAKFTTWFYRVVTNQALDYVRKKKPSYDSENLDRFVDGKQNQLQELEDNKMQVDIERAINALPERQRSALNLCFYEGLSNKEAADVLGVGIKALESLLMRAKAGLREEMVRKGYLSKEQRYG